MAHWTILTCEYPPGCGGVGDYTAQVAAALAGAGDRVTVVCPPKPVAGARDASQAEADAAGVELVMLDDAYGRLGRRALDERLDRGAPTIVLVQYVPTGFGLRGANIPWSRWLLDRARRHGNDVRVMFHEPYFEFTRSMRQNALAVAERVMAAMLLRAASRVYVSTDAWRRYLAPYAPGGRPYDFVTLPVPSTIPRCDRLADIAERRRQLLGVATTQLDGHFGTVGPHVAPLLEATLIPLLTIDPNVSAVCLGSGTDEFVRALVAKVPMVRGRVHGAGRVSRSDAALTLNACDLLLQPYPDGVTTRRTSVMAGLVNSRAIVTTSGHLTEPVWAESGAVALAAASDIESLVAAVRSLLATDEDRAALAARGEATYRARFALDHTIHALRGAVEGAAA